MAGRSAPWVRERLLGVKHPADCHHCQAVRESNTRRKSKFTEEERRSRRRAVQRATNIKSRYGITVEEYDRLLLLQNGLCAICKGACSTGKRLAVDHEHETGKVRGLLCRRCNRGLGHFPQRAMLLRALAYLEEHADQSHK